MEHHFHTCTNCGDELPHSDKDHPEMDCEEFQSSIVEACKALDKELGYD